MLPMDLAFWTDRLRRTLAGYDEPLLRAVSGRLLKPRNQWPVEELIERSLATIGNAAVIDRRLQDQDRACRRLLALIAHSRQPCWHLGNVLELLAALGHADGPLPVFALLEAGLLYPELPDGGRTSNGRASGLRSFEQWLGQAAASQLRLFAHPAVAQRAEAEDLGLPDLSTDEAPAAAPQEADGLEWPLRLAVVWQQAAQTPLRRTQQGDFFKRDLERLRSDPLLAGAPFDALADLPDLGPLAATLAQTAGLLQAADSDWIASQQAAFFEQDLPAVVAALWTALLQVESWSPLEGWKVNPTGVQPYPSAYLLLLLLLARLPQGRWARPADLEDWLFEHHPYWAGENVRPSRRRSWVPEFLLGLAYSLRLVQAARAAAGDWLVRLSETGRWLVGAAELAQTAPTYPQTLLVQPNLELLVYRQGLTPQLIGRLGRMAAWRGLSSACTLQLCPDTVYRALEGGETFETILQTLQQHGMRPTPAPVIEALRTWADKRERISVYLSASLFEFNNAEDLQEALVRGLPAIRLTDRLALVSREVDVDYRHFRITGSRDYASPPEPCVTVEADGVTLVVDPAKSDLLVETELLRFAEPVQPPAVNGRQRYRLTPQSLSAKNGVSVQSLEEWFSQRCGQPLSAAARLLLTAPQMPAVTLRRRVVLTLTIPEHVDGLYQWPETSRLLEERLGPTTVAVAEDKLAALLHCLRQLGIMVQE